MNELLKSSTKTFGKLAWLPFIAVFTMGESGCPKKAPPPPPAANSEPKGVNAAVDKHNEFVDANEAEKTRQAGVANLREFTLKTKEQADKVTSEAAARASSERVSIQESADTLSGKKSEQSGQFKVQGLRSITDLANTFLGTRYAADQERDAQKDVAKTNKEARVETQRLSNEGQLALEQERTRQEMIRAYLTADETKQQKMQQAKLSQVQAATKELDLRSKAIALVRSSKSLDEAQKKIPLDGDYSKLSNLVSEYYPLKEATYNKGAPGSYLAAVGGKVDEGMEFYNKQIDSLSSGDSEEIANALGTFASHPISESMKTIRGYSNSTFKEKPEGSKAEKKGVDGDKAEHPKDDDLHPDQPTKDERAGDHKLEEVFACATADNCKDGSEVKTRLKEMYEALAAVRKETDKDKAYALYRDKYLPALKKFNDQGYAEGSPAYNSAKLIADAAEHPKDMRGSLEDYIKAEGTSQLADYQEGYRNYLKTQTPKDPNTAVGALLGGVKGAEASVAQNGSIYRTSLLAGGVKSAMDWMYGSDRVNAKLAQMAAAEAERKRLRGDATTQPSQ